MKLFSQAIFKDDCTYVTDIEEKLRDNFVKYDFNDDSEFKYVKKMYLDLLIQVHSISTNQGQSAIVNITPADGNRNLGELEFLDGYWHLNFFDSEDVRFMCPAFGKKLYIHEIKQLLFRGVDPFQVMIRERETDNSSSNRYYTSIC